MSYRTGEELVAEAKTRIREITPAEATGIHARRDDTIFLDVREPNEWNLGRIPGAMHLPRGNIESKAEGMLDRGKPIVIYCARGNRSALAADTMQQMGYSDVCSMSEGFGAWVGVGGDVEE